MVFYIVSSVKFAIILTDRNSELLSSFDRVDTKSTSVSCTRGFYSNITWYETIFDKYSILIFSHFFNHLNKRIFINEISVKGKMFVIEKKNQLDRCLWFSKHSLIVDIFEHFLLLDTFCVLSLSLHFLVVLFFCL